MEKPRMENISKDIRSRMAEILTKFFPELFQRIQKIKSNTDLYDIFDRRVAAFLRSLPENEREKMMRESLFVHYIIGSTVGDEFLASYTPANESGVISWLEQILQDVEKSVTEPSQPSI